MSRPGRALYITSSRAARPAARRVIFCDGGIDASYRDGVDLELSHWIPNSTPPPYKASTSTEICLRFIESVASRTRAAATPTSCDSPRWTSSSPS